MANGNVPNGDVLPPVNPDSRAIPLVPERIKPTEYIELAKMSQESFFNRRSYEWKVAFGLWTAIGLITYYVCEHPKVMTPALIGLTAFIYLAILGLWHFAWQVPLRTAFENDQQFKHYYMHQAEGRNAVFPEKDKLIKYGDVIWSTTDWGWNWGQTLMTGVFLLGSWILMWSTFEPKDKSDTTKVEFKATGGASLHVHTHVNGEEKVSKVPGVISNSPSEMSPAHSPAVPAPVQPSASPANPGNTPPSSNSKQ